MKAISIAILSDLHFAGTDAAKGLTHVLVHHTKPKLQDPIRDLFDLIKAESLAANLVISPGDLTVASCEIGLKAAWAELQKIATSLDATQVIASTGNHDIHSRDAEKSPEVWEVLKQLDPSYPIPGCSERTRLHYWAEHFSIFDYEWARIVVLNSCNCHGRGDKEYEKGRVTEYTINLIQSELAKMDSKLLNILLCHHHPSALPELSGSHADYSEMVHGAKLLNSLEESSDNWVVVHGHKHYPTVTYAKGGSVSPVILSAGSFGAALDSRYFATGTNQFYIVDFNRESIEDSGSAGIIRAWDWTNGTGWKRATTYDASRPHRLIYGSGFGNRENPTAVAKRIDVEIGANVSIEWSKLSERMPQLAHMLIQDRITLIRQLRDRHNVHTTNADPMTPTELVRKAP